MAIAHSQFFWPTSKSYPIIGELINYRKSQTVLRLKPHSLRPCRQCDRRHCGVQWERETVEHSEGTGAPLRRSCTVRGWWVRASDHIASPAPAGGLHSAVSLASRPTMTPTSCRSQGSRGAYDARSAVHAWTRNSPHRLPRTATDVRHTHDDTVPAQRIRVGLFPLLAQWSGTLSQISSTTWRSVQTVLGVYLKHTCSCDTSASSTLDVLNDNCAI